MIQECVYSVCLRQIVDGLRVVMKKRSL